MIERTVESSNRGASFGNGTAVFLGVFTAVLSVTHLELVLPLMISN